MRTGQWTLPSKRGRSAAAASGATLARDTSACAARCHSRSAGAALPADGAPGAAWLAPGSVSTSRLSRSMACSRCGCGPESKSMASNATCGDGSSSAANTGVQSAERAGQRPAVDAEGLVAHQVVGVGEAGRHHLRPRRLGHGARRRAGQGDERQPAHLTVRIGGGRGDGLARRPASRRRVRPSQGGARESCPPPRPAAAACGARAPSASNAARFPARE